MRNLPWYAQRVTVPREWKLFAGGLLVPLWTGAFAVHYLDNNTGRDVMGASLHYACMLVAVQSGLHWGMEAIQFGLPTHTVEFTPLYRFMRFGLPIVPLTVCILASRLAVENPRAASVLLLCTMAAGTSGNFFAYAFATCPVWFTRFQWQVAAGITGGLGTLMLSDKMKLRGELQLMNTHT